MYRSLALLAFVGAFGACDAQGPMFFEDVDYDELALTNSPCVTAYTSPNSPAGSAIAGFGVVHTIEMHVNTGMCPTGSLLSVTYAVEADDNSGNEWDTCGDGLGADRFADPAKWALYDEDQGDIITDNADVIFFTAAGQGGCDTDGDGDHDPELLDRVRFKLGHGSTGVFGFSDWFEVSLLADSTDASDDDDDRLKLDAIRVVVNTGNGPELVPNMPAPGYWLNF